MEYFLFAGSLFPVLGIVATLHCRYATAGMLLSYFFYSQSHGITFACVSDMGKKKLQPLRLELDALKPFVEKDTEINKKMLISRCAGKVNYSMFTLLKQLDFYALGKDHNGNLFIV